MKLLRQILLAPFSAIYGLLISIRNIAYNTGILKEQKVSKIVISVGNLNVGGTGKTPHIEYLIRLLKKEFKISTLSRGYKRKTSGFLLASEKTTIYDIGDEPMQYFKKFNDVSVCVCENRIEGVERMLSHNPDVDLFLLDDAYQHRAIARDLNILITDYNNPYFNDYLMPSGNLREWRCQSKRADIIIVSKTTNNLSKKNIDDFLQKINSKPHQKVYFSYIKYSDLHSFNSNTNTPLNNNTSVLLITGIANPKPLKNYVSDKFNLAQELSFPDHHQFNQSDISKIKSTFKAIKTDNKIIITTEKDIMRLYLPELKNQLANLPLFYIPIEVDFHGNSKEDFDKVILDYVRTNSRN